MILAAGLGKRLRPLTDDTPKALVEVGGVPMLERVARRLVDAGAERLIVNVHHHADRIEAFLAERGGFGVEVRLSHEREGPLETGGGLLRAADLFERKAPFFLHNVDVISEIDLSGLYRVHGAVRGEPPLATLAVARRETSRPLLVDAEGVYGVADHRTGVRREARRPGAEPKELGFAGIHVLSPEIFDRLLERGAFSIVESYMRLIAEGVRILAHEVGDAPWFEVGTPERLERARQWVERRSSSRP